MPTEEELLDAIREIESKESSYENCKKLVIFHEMYNIYYKNNDKNINNNSYDGEKSVEYLLNNKDHKFIIDLFLEILECLKITNYKLYESIINRLY